MLSELNGIYILFMCYGVSFSVVVLTLFSSDLFEKGGQLLISIIVSGSLVGGFALTLVDHNALKLMQDWLPK